MTSFAIAGLLLFAAGEPRIFSLDAGVSVWDVATLDVNGDNRGDVVAICCDELSDPLNKYLAVFLADDSGGYASTPALKTRIDPSVGAFFEAEIDGTPPKEILAANSDGATSLGYKDGELKTLMEFPFVSMFPTGSREPGFLKGAAEDLDEDGIDEWFVPMPSGFSIRNSKGPLADIRCDVKSNIRTGSGISISSRYPAYHAFEQGEGRRKGIAFLSDEFADFAYGDGWTQHKRFKIPVNLDDKWDTSANMEDINADGMPDLIVTQTQGTINLKALTQVYLAEGTMAYPDKPTATFESNGSFAAPMLKDVNGDKKLDLVFINIPFGVKFFVNLFVWRKLGVDLEIYLYTESGFATKPDYTTSVSIDAPDGKEQSAYALGDFNGDGNTDAAFGVGRDKMLLHAGGDVRFISPKPYLTLTVPAFGVARARDLNGNAAEDLIIFHPGITGKERIEVLVF
ncbi:MAG: VCBS repeat-containing protein [Candidatus Hydrogenedentes bacterium]|nr:VCBS repeat-containing protein [Candidatus Hydrogenedentota bacterium]